jgi:hypothetical protein
MSKWINSVKRVTFWSNTDAVNQLLKRQKPELHFGIASVMLFTHLASLFGFVKTGASFYKNWIILDASAFAWVISIFKPMPVVAWFAN